MKLAQVQSLMPQIRARLESFDTFLELLTGVDLGIKGLLGRKSDWISLGIRIGDGENGYRLAVRFRTPTRLPLWEEWILKRIFKFVKASDLDVQYTGPVLAIPLAGPPPPAAVANGPLRIGSSISHASTRAGTLGFFAKSLDDGPEGFVSANHVIGLLDDAHPNDPIVHPGGSGNNPVVGRFVRAVPLRIAGERFVDAAFAARVPGVPFDATALPNGQRLSPTLSDLTETSVFKFAEGSGETSGRVLSFNFDKLRVLSYGEHLNLVPFEDQIEIESDNAARRFSTGGDSGSLVWDRHHRAVGLLFANTEQGGTHHNGLSYVNPIGTVLSKLRVELL
jgi:hypothetical protein